MPSDPRCPACGEKVSATATWCMHCSADFDAPVDAERGGAQMDTAASTDDRVGDETGGDPLGTDEGGQTRATAVAAGLGFAAWTLLAAVVPLGGWAGLIALAALVALVFHLRSLPTPVDMVVRASYGTAVLLVGLRFYVALASSKLDGVLDGGALVVLAALVFGARWADENRDRFDVSALDTTSGR